MQHFGHLGAIWAIANAESFITSMQTLERASKDTEEWVVVTAHALKGFPTKSGLNFDLESATDKFADALNHISSASTYHHCILLICFQYLTLDHYRL
jgi:hypothetical protein